MLALVVRAGMHIAASACMGHIDKILVPIDGSPASTAALTQAVELAEDLGASVDVLHVRSPEPDAADDEAPQEKEMEGALASAAELLGSRLERKTEAGDPVRKILEHAADARADLIVMGTHGRVGRMHALVGSVAEGVVRNATCPVLTVHCPSGEEESFSERIHGRMTIGEQVPSSR